MSNEKIGKELSLISSDIPLFRCKYLYYLRSLFYVGKSSWQLTGTRPQLEYIFLFNINIKKFIYFLAQIRISLYECNLFLERKYL